MRIAVDARPLSYRLTGIGVYLTHLLNEMQNIDSRNHYYLISNAAIDYALINPRWRKIEGNLKKRLLSTLWMQSSAPVITRKLKIDVFWGPRHHLPLFLPSNIRTMLTIHDLVYRFYPETMALPNLLVERLLLKRSVQRAHVIITDTRSTAADVTAEFEIDPKKVFPIHLGTPRLPRSVEPKSGLPHDLPPGFFLFVGTLDPRKNFRRILEAFSLLDPVKHDVHLLIVGGEGWKNKKFHEMLKGFKIRSHVHLRGYVSLDLLALYYERAVCLVFPSLYEGFGLPILEAMSCGTPVITSNVSSMKEVSGDAALLIDPLDIKGLAAAMKRMLRDEPLRERLRVRGFQRAKRFSWKRCAEQTLRVLHMLDQQ
ncbi:MAG: glycosyltransferase family 1 protein [Desulfatiglandaceae bacterium]